MEEDEKVVMENGALAEEKLFQSFPPFVQNEKHIKKGGVLITIVQ